MRWSGLFEKPALGGPLYSHIALIDSSAVIALEDSRENHHLEARRFFKAQKGLTWAAVNVTWHETFTRIRYRRDVVSALSGFDFLRAGGIVGLNFEKADEVKARDLLIQYGDHKISFHDALCAAVMHRNGIYRIFTFDKDFWILGFQVLPTPRNWSTTRVRPEP